MDNCILSNNQPRYLSPLLPQSFAFPGSPDRQSCSRDQPNHPEIGSVTSIFGSTAFSMCIWSLLLPTCPNPSSHESIILSLVHPLLLEASSEPWKFLMARDRTRVGKFQGLGPCSSAHVDCHFLAQRGILGETERKWPLGAAHRVTRSVLVFSHFQLSQCPSLLPTPRTPPALSPWQYKFSMALGWKCVWRVFAR